MSYDLTIDRLIRQAMAPDFVRVIESQLRAPASASEIIRQQLAIPDLSSSLSELINTAALQQARHHETLVHAAQSAVTDSYKPLDVRELFSPVLEQIADVLSTINLEATSYITQLSSVDQLARQLSVWAREFSAEADSYKTALGSIAQLSAAPTLGFVGDSLQRSIRGMLDLADLRVTFGWQVLEALGRLQDAETEEETEALVDDIEQLFQRELERLPRTRISLEGMLQIFLTIVIFFTSYQSTRQSEDRLSQRLNAIEQTIENHLEALEDESTANSRYVVTKAVRLRAGPSTEYKVLAVLQPNMVIEVFESQKLWLHAWYFDYTDLELKTGWVYKRYLRPAGEVDLSEMKGFAQDWPVTSDEFLASSSLVRSQSGRLSARRVAELFDLSLAELANLLQTSQQALGRSDDDLALQQGLYPYARVVQLCTVFSVDEFREWLHRSNPHLDDREPIDLIAEGRIDIVADLVEDMLSGSPG